MEMFFSGLLSVRPDDGLGKWCFVADGTGFLLDIRHGLVTFVFSMRRNDG